MTFHLVHSDDGALLASDRAVIKASEMAAFQEAVTLLQAAAAIRDRATAASEDSRRAGYAEGLAEARSGIAEHLAEQIADFAAALDQHEQLRRSDIAEAALAAVRAIVGELADEALVPRMVERTLARLPEGGPVKVMVAPALEAAVAARLGARTYVSLVPDAGLGPADCVIRTSAGQVIASLSVQLDTLAKRWGVTA